MRTRTMSIPWILWWATIVHVVLATSILFRPDIQELSVLMGFGLVVPEGPSRALVLPLYLASAAASWALLHEHRLKRSRVIMLLFPQYFLVVVGLISNVIILERGSYRNSEFEFWQGLVLLLPSMAAGVLHTFGILERYLIRWNK